MQLKREHRLKRRDAEKQRDAEGGSDIQRATSAVGGNGRKETNGTGMSATIKIRVALEFGRCCGSQTRAPGDRNWPRRCSALRGIWPHLLVWAWKRNKCRAPGGLARSRGQFSSRWRFGYSCTSVPLPDATLGDGDVAARHPYRRSNAPRSGAVRAGIRSRASRRSIRGEFSRRGCG